MTSEFRSSCSVSWFERHYKDTIRSACLCACLRVWKPYPSPARSDTRLPRAAAVDKWQDEKEARLQNELETEVCADGSQEAQECVRLSLSSREQGRGPLGWTWRPLQEDSVASFIHLQQYLLDNNPNYPCLPLRYNKSSVSGKRSWLFLWLLSCIVTVLNNNWRKAQDLRTSVGEV